LHVVAQPDVAVNRPAQESGDSPDYLPVAAANQLPGAGKDAGRTFKEERFSWLHFQSSATSRRRTRRTT
jgi:hypothetical protein